jgi:SNF2 family DNA or RNA helicase
MREIADWHPDPRRIRMLTAESRKTSTKFEYGWALISYEQLERHAIDLRRQEWDLLVLDEGHAVKEPERRRSVLIYGGNWRGKTYSAIPARKALVVSGTPMKNRVEELFPLLHFLDPANWPDRDEFIETFYESPLITPERRVVQNIPPRYLNELHILLKRSVLVRTPKDQIQSMPSRRFEKVEVPLDDKTERDWFDEKAEKLLNLSYVLRSKQRKYNRNPTPELRDEIRKLQERLREMQSAIYQHATRAKRHAILDYLLKLPPEHKAVVIGFHRDLLLDQLARALHQRGRHFVFHHGGNSRYVDRTVRAFQTDPQVQFFLGQLNVSNLSLTLTAASHVVFTEIPQTRADFDQAFDRVHRLTQKAPECTATVFSVTWPSAGDEDLLDALLHWKNRASQVLDGKETDPAWDWHLPVEHRPDERMSHAPALPPTLEDEKGDALRLPSLSL